MGIRDFQAMCLSAPWLGMCLSLTPMISKSVVSSVTPNIFGTGLDFLKTNHMEEIFSQFGYKCPRHRV